MRGRWSINGMISIEGSCFISEINLLVCIHILRCMARWINDCRLRYALVVCISGLLVWYLEVQNTLRPFPIDII